MRSTCTKLFASVLLALVLLASCDLNQFEEYGWKPTLLGPLLKTRIDYYDLEDLVDIRTEYDINAGDLEDDDGNKYPENQEIDVPPFGPLPKFPSQYRKMFTTDDGETFVQSAIIERFKAQASFNNVFPIPIGEGTRLVIRDSANTDNIILDHPIERDVAPGETYSIDINIEEVTEITGTLEFYIEDFQSPGKDNITFTGEDFIVNFEVELLDIKELNLVPDLSYSIERSNPFELNIEEGEVDAYDGSIYLWVTNAFPTQFDLSIALIDSTGGTDEVVHQFFMDEEGEGNGNGLYTIDAAELDDDGRVLNPVESDRVTLVEIKDVPELNRANKIRVSGVFKTDQAPPAQYVLTDQTYIDVLITTKMQIDPSKAGN